MKRFLPLCLAVLLTPAMAWAQVIVNDSWADGGRDNGADPLDADWWTSSASTGIEVSVGSLGLVTGISGRGIHGTFAPQTLGIGEMLRVTYTFTTPATVGVNLASPFRVAVALGALSQETRLALFRLLVQFAPDGLPAGEIADRLRVPATTLSFHLKELSRAGLVESRSEGRS